MTVLLAEELGEEVFGQYASDHAFNPDDPRLRSDPLRVKSPGGDGNIRMHDKDTMFDEASGHLPDPATGLPPSTKDKDPLEYEYVRTGGLSIGKAVDAEIAKRRPNRVDDAEKWLREHDPNYTHNRQTWR